MKVAQEIDVDNVTIIINPQNKLEAKIPTSTPTSVEIEEIDAHLQMTDSQGLVVHKNDTNTDHPLTKLGRVKGTDWLVIRANDVFGDVKPVPEYDRSNLVGWNATGDDDIVTYIKDGNNIVGATTTISFDSNLPAGMSFDVNFELGNRLVKTVNVVSEGQSQFTVTTGVTDFKFDTSTGGELEGEIYINNVKNNIVNHTKYNLTDTRVSLVGLLPRD